jgi:hypothetical protein
MRTVAPSETKKCAQDEDFSQKTFDLPQFGHFFGKPRPRPCRGHAFRAGNSAGDSVPKGRIERKQQGKRKDACS